MKAPNCLFSQALLLLAGAYFTCTTTLEAANVTVAVPDTPTIKFALKRLEGAMAERGDSLSL
jgi:hypothetical protein